MKEREKFPLLCPHERERKREREYAQKGYA
jgi:hypothetical protein